MAEGATEWGSVSGYAQADTEQALAREAQLRERLRAAGIDPDSE